MSKIFVRGRPRVQAVLDDFSRQNPHSAAIEVFRKPFPRPFYVVGKNAETQAVLAKLPVAGIIDDFAPEGSVWNGVPVVSSRSVPIGTLVINTSTSISPLSTQRRVEAIPGARHISYSDLTRPNSLALPLPAFVSEARAVFTSNEMRWQAIYDRFADDESRRVFEKVFAFRLTADPSYMDGFKVALQDQYFEPFAKPGTGATFVDCGGYDGDTTEEFIRRNPDYHQVYLYEPSVVNLAKAKQRLAQARDIVFLPFGVSDADATLSFDAEAGSASSISTTGRTSIEVTTLDATLPISASFIKMDLEGWELPALRGGAKHIQNNRPTLAIAVYHHATDFWEIPEYIFSLSQDFSLYMRHYTEGWSETVMYFVPHSKESPACHHDLGMAAEMRVEAT